MRKLFIAVSALGLMASPALAGGDLEGHCEAYAAENGTDPSGCGCLAEAADADMTAELMEVTGEADLETLSDASKEAIAACWPDSAA